MVVVNKTKQKKLDQDKETFKCFPGVNVPSETNLFP